MLHQPWGEIPQPGIRPQPELPSDGGQGEERGATLPLEMTWDQIQEGLTMKTLTRMGSFQDKEGLSNRSTCALAL
jgi:hypothetical protein